MNLPICCADADSKRLVGVQIPEGAVDEVLERLAGRNGSAIYLSDSDDEPLQPVQLPPPLHQHNHRHQHPQMHQQQPPLQQHGLLSDSEDEPQQPVHQPLPHQYQHPQMQRQQPAQPPPLQQQPRPPPLHQPQQLHQPPVYLQQWQRQHPQLAPPGASGSHAWQQQQLQPYNSIDLT